MLNTKNNQRGSSLIEVMGVISIIGVLGVSALKIIANVHDVFNVSMASSEIKDLQKGISGVYDYSGNYDKLFQNDVYKTLCETDKVVPSRMCVKKDSNYILRHKLSGNVLLEKISATESLGYKITFDGLDKKNCIKLSQLDWLDRKKISIFQLDINGTPIAYFPKKNNKEFPILLSNASSGCNKGNNENSITWYFY